jgi:hypothetical protein
MNFSPKQEDYVNYMLKRIGFSDKDIITYLGFLSQLFNEYNYKLSSLENSYFNTSNCVGVIKEEFELKKYSPFKPRTKSNLISATDLSNFTFCPASYSINSSFEIEHPNGAEFTEQGKKLHEDLKAIKKSWLKEKGADFLERNVDLSQIKKSKIIVSIPENSTI